MTEAIFIYGAGNLGKRVAQHLQTQGFPVLAFVDPVKAGERVAGLQVHAMKEVPPGGKLLISVLNNSVNVESVRQVALNYGFSSVLSPPEVFFWLGEIGVDDSWYWLTTDRELVSSVEREARLLLEPRLTPESLPFLEDLLRYRGCRQSGTRHILPLGKQYIETGIEDFWHGPVRLLDGGAFTGDTLVTLRGAGVHCEEIFCFEPDLINASRLCSTVNNLGMRAVVFPAALGDCQAYVPFEHTGLSGSRVDPAQLTEGSVIQVSADECLVAQKLTHVKLDVEGSELSALRGMRRLIARDCPALAVSVYHRPDDLVTITRFLLESDRYQTWSLRTYAHQTFETILYVK